MQPAINSNCSDKRDKIIITIIIIIIIIIIIKNEIKKEDKLIAILDQRSSKSVWIYCI